MVNEARQFIDRWQALIALACGIAVAVGVDVLTPSDRLRAVESSLVQYKAGMDSTKARVSTIEDYARMLITGECIDRPERETRLMGLPCSELLKENAR